MRPGDLVELKEGLFGLEPPDNCGIVLERRKEGKGYVLDVYTVKGRKTVKKDRLGAARLATGLTGEEGDDELRARLAELSGALADAKETPPRETDDRALWEQLVEAKAPGSGDGGGAVEGEGAEGTWTAEEAAKVVYDLDRPMPDHVASVREALQSCGDGVGYFRRDGAAWRPLTPDVVEAARDDIEALQRLRNKLVRVEVVEDGEGFERRVLVPVEDPDLDEADRRMLDEVVAPAMRDFVLHDEDRRPVGLGGVEGENGDDGDVVALDGFSLASYLRHLARDATGQEGTSVSSAYAAFLLKYGLDDLESVYERIMRRWVLDSPFDWDVPDVAVRAADRLEAFDHGAHGEAEGRTDLRHLDTVTIDPPDARDFDDAVSLTDDALWVHIADVGRYVEPDSTMDAEAARRGTSAYLPTRVLPMLPPRLADDLCSLRAGEDRPAMSVRLPLDWGLDAEEGPSFEPEFHVSTVHVDSNLSYDEVDAWIEEGTEPYASLSALAERWLAAREGLALETAELRVGLGDAGVETTTKRATPATRLIEAFMVAANEAVARFLTDREVPLPYRCHPLPDRRGVETFNAQAEAMGLELRVEVPGVEADGAEEDGPGAGDGGGRDRAGGTRAATSEAEEEDLLEALKSGGKLSIGFGGGGAERPEAEGEAAEGEEDVDEATGEQESGPALKGLAQLSPEERAAWLEPFQRALDTVNALDDERLKQVVNGKLLACLGRALYLETNVGHFGLGSTCYLHFTSPIRRYPDLLVHRQLKATLADEDPPYTTEDLAPRCQRSTERAIAAERLEWTLKDVALVFRSTDEAFEGAQTGVVNGMTGGGAFISLDGGFEARVAVQDLPGGPLEVDEHQARLLDRDGQAVVTLGQTVAVRLTGRDLVEGKLACRVEHLGRTARERLAGEPGAGGEEE